MFETRRSSTLTVAACALLALASCGQRGPLYMPDRNARVATHPAAVSSAPASSAPADSSSPASAPSLDPR
jgi:predicted small lipoprotein YifL